MFNSGLAAAFIDTLIGSSDSSIGKYVTTRIGTYKYTIFILGIGLIPTIIYFFLFGNIGTMTIDAVVLSVTSSFFLGLGFILFYEALKTQQITHAAALGEIQPVILLLFGVLILGEAITTLEAVGALVIFAGAFLVITTDKLKINWKLLPIVLANISWSLYWILLTYAIGAYGGEGFPMLASRGVAFVLILAFALSMNRVEKSVNKPAGIYHTYLLWFLIIFAGLVDGGYNLIFGYIIKVQIVAVAAALLAAGPLISLVIGRVFFGDKLDRRQKIGFVLAMIGAMLIAL